MVDHDPADARRIFEMVIAADADLRAQVLDRECGPNRDLRSRVELLLAAERERFMASPTIDVPPPSSVVRAGTHTPHAGDSRVPSYANAGTGGPAGSSSSSGSLASAVPTESAGSSIGPYKLLRVIGEGGFGSVWLAEQDKPVSRKVALKIIKLGMDTRQVVARFEQERQALAILDHPSIAKVFDAGATETGRPYFVMELCAGEPIDAYCDRAKLTVEQRLGLFAEVCAAVQHAHTKGIIHRDIKPSNVLVSMRDGRPHAKVIDFGIAKATSSKMTERTLFTEHRQLIGTPEYMSPEQAEGSLDIDTRTDVYSLGVLLYQLLTGSTPFSGDQLRSAAYGEIQRIIREVEPPSPSARLSQSRETLSGAAAQRGDEPSRLRARVRGELDWIVMKALEKDRTRRYDTPNSLADDVRRFLSGHAVHAAPASAAYRVRTFVRRNRAGVLAASLIAAALVLGVIGTAVGLVDARRQRRIAEERLAESEATVSFLDEMLAAVDPGAQGKDVTVRAVLDGAAASVGDRFVDRPLVAARLHGTIGRTYIGLGAFDRADPHVRAQLSLRARVLGESHEETRRAVNDLADLQIRQGAYPEAQRALEQAIVVNERLFGRNHPITLYSIESLGALLVVQMQPGQAAPLLKEVLEARLVNPGLNHKQTIGTMYMLATAQTDLREFDEATRGFETALQAQERLTSPDHPLALNIRSDLAWMHYCAAMDGEQVEATVARGHLEKAREIGEKTLAARERVLGPEHQETLTSMNNLASVYKQLGMLGEAEALCLRDLEVCLRVLGEEHPDTVISLSNVGNFYRAQRRFAEALPYFERSLRAARRVFPPDSVAIANPLGHYGSTLRGLGRFAEAEAPLTDVHRIFTRELGEDHPSVRQTMLGLALLYEAWEDAEPGKGYAAKAASWRDLYDQAAPKP